MLVSVRKIHGIINEQIDKGISSERIILGGFSQGGAIALLVLSQISLPVGSVLIGGSLGRPYMRTQARRDRWPLHLASPASKSRKNEDRDQ